MCRNRTNQITNDEFARYLPTLFIKKANSNVPNKDTQKVHRKKRQNKQYLIKEL